MPDLTDQFIQESTPDPLYFPLSPTVDNLSQYAEDLEYEGNQITIEWAIHEMQGHQMSWVKLGLVADRVRRYRLYRDKYPDWQTFCKEVLGKKGWQIDKTIKFAKAALYLLDQEFSVLPTCKSQVEKLIDCCKKSGQLLEDAWSSVVEQLPKPSLLTVNSIGEALGFPTEYEPKLSKHQRDNVAEIARRRGITFSEQLDEWIAMESEPEPEPDDEEEFSENEPNLSVDPNDWQSDMQELVREHDSQLWFLSAIARLVKPQVSQFNWLRNVRCQV